MHQVIFGIAILLALALASCQTQTASAQSAFGSTIGSSSFGTNTGQQAGQMNSTGSSAMTAGGAANPFGGAASGGVMGDASQLLGAVGLSNLFTNNQNGQTGQVQNRGTTGMTQGGRGMGMTTNRMGNMGRGGMATNRNMRAGGMANSDTPIRARLTVGFPLPPVATTVPTQRLQRQLQFPQLENSQTSITVTTTSTQQGMTAVLRGTVATAELRMVAEQLALMEPGIASVQNELLVSSTQAPQVEMLPEPQLPPLPSLR